MVAPFILLSTSSSVSSVVGFTTSIGERNERRSLPRLWPPALPGILVVSSCTLRWMLEEAGMRICSLCGLVTWSRYARQTDICQRCRNFVQGWDYYPEESLSFRRRGGVAWKLNGKVLDRK